MGSRRGLVNLICEYNDALSDPQRVKMMKIMGSNEANSVSVSNFASILGISQPSATKHLKILHAVDLITRKRIGTSVYYSLNIKTINEYHQLLDTAFVKGFSPCPYGFNCDECPEMDTCA
ncbi:MAG: metalloregulator ArsR/SmtB family transcription factor [Chloroflexi bacterium]|nr:metalloregulator ArsR/SmtB family transcription factor [Chloroflexota bacterium]